MGNHIVVVSSDVLGVGPEELGRVLMLSFFKSLAAAVENPAAVLFLNSGVRLTTEGSELIEVLQEIESQGAAILSCGTCLDYFGLRDNLVAGKVGNMMDFVDRMQSASSVIKI